MALADVTTAVCVVALIVGAARARGADDDVDPALESARKVYQAIADEFQATQPTLDNIEALANWSNRIFILETAMSECGLSVDRLAAELRAKQWREAQHRHVTRMKELEAPVQNALRAGEVKPVVLDAVQFFRLQAERMGAKLDSVISAADGVGVDVELPTREAKPLQVTPKELFIELDQQGNTLIGGKLQTPESVKKTVKEFITRNPPTKTVVIRANPEALFQHVVGLMDLLKSLDVDFTLTTKSSNN